MKAKSVWLQGLVACSGSLIAFALNGQELADGVWAGTRTGPQDSSPVLDVEMRITNRPDGTIALYVLHALGISQAENVQLENGTLSYTFAVPGRDVRSNCELELQEDGSYRGPCLGSNGAEFVYSYSPPRG